MASSDSEGSLPSSQDDSQNELNEEPDDEYVWSRLQDEANRRHDEQWKELVEQYEEQGNSQEVAQAKATNDLVPTYRNELRQVLLETMKWMRNLKKDPLYKKILETMKNFMDDDDFDWTEAAEAAIDKRKFLLNKLFGKQSIPEQPTVPAWSGRFYQRY